MVMGDFHGRFEPLIFRSFQEKVGKGNVTKKLEEFMRHFNSNFEGDLDENELETLDIEITILNNKKIKIDTELDSKLSKRDRILDILQEKEKKRLEAEKKTIQEAIKCKNCGKIIDNPNMKVHKYAVGKICNTCYLAASRDKIWEWMGNGTKTIQ